MRLHPLASLFAATLILGVGPARAASVTYDFIEAAGSPNPGSVGAFITFASPPAEPNMTWTTSDIANILAIGVTDSAIGPVGVYTPASFDGANSLTGAMLDGGAILTTAPGGDLFTFAFSPLVGVDSIDGSQRINPGDFVLASVPEPSSLVLGSIAALAGVGHTWHRRRRRVTIVA